MFDSIYCKLVFDLIENVKILSNIRDFKFVVDIIKFHNVIKVVYRFKNAWRYTIPRRYGM